MVEPAVVPETLKVRLPFAVQVSLVLVTVSEKFDNCANIPWEQPTSKKTVNNKLRVTFPILKR